jgi:Uma2 family endonuclease
VISPSTGRLDRVKKMPHYAQWGVGHVWLVDPIWRSLEVFKLRDGIWQMQSTHTDDAKVRAEPFDAVELDLALLWAR